MEAALPPNLLLSSAARRLPKMRPALVAAGGADEPRGLEVSEVDESALPA
jgi:hypothetical protein